MSLMDDVAVALGLDPCCTPVASLVKRVKSLKRDLDQIRKSADFRYLLQQDGSKDCTVQVRIGPSGNDESPKPKRAKTAKKKAGGSASSSSSTPTTETVRAHSLILSSKSEYFKAALVRGQWAESQDKTIDIDLPSEEAFHAFKLLVDLSYGPCYTFDGDGRLSPDMLLQLIMVANMFEFIGCIAPCCEAISDVVNEDNALAIIEFLCHLDTAHESIHELIDVAVGSLKPLRASPPGKFSTIEEDAALACAIASCHGLQAINSIDLLISILKSDRLAIDSENTTFTLVQWWIEGREGWTKEQKQEAFNKIHTSGALRYHCMDPLYLASYATRIPWVEASGHGLSIIQQALRESSRTSDISRGPSLPMNRGSAGEDRIMVEATREELTAEHDNRCFLGIFQGYPILAIIKKTEVVDGFGLFVGWCGGSSLQKDAGAGPVPGISLEVDALLTPDSAFLGRFQLVHDVLEEGRYAGCSNVFHLHQPWQDVLAEGSRHFFNGIMKITFFLSDRDSDDGEEEEEEEGEEEVDEEDSFY